MALLGDFAGGPPASPSGGDVEGSVPPTSGPGSRGRYRKRGTAAAASDDESLLAGVGRGGMSGIGRGKLAAKLGGLSHNETLISFP